MKIMINANIHNQKSALAAPVLGQREIETLGFFWRTENAHYSATDILELLRQQAESTEHIISLNTVQSTTERLWRKKLLTRYKQGKAYKYVCVYSKQEVIGSLIDEISRSLGEDDDTAIISGIFTFLKSKSVDSKVALVRTLEQDLTQAHSAR